MEGGLDPTVESIGVVTKTYHERRRLSTLDAGDSACNCGLPRPLSFVLITASHSTASLAVLFLSAIVRRRFPARERQVVVDQPDQEGEEPAQPLLGVGSGVEVDADDPHLRGVLARSPRSPGSLISVLVFHIAWLERRVQGPLLSRWWSVNGPADADGRGERRRLLYPALTLGWGPGRTPPGAGAAAARREFGSSCPP